MLMMAKMVGLPVGGDTAAPVTVGALWEPRPSSAYNYARSARLTDTSAFTVIQASQVRLTRIGSDLGLSGNEYEPHAIGSSGYLAVAPLNSSAVVVAWIDEGSLKARIINDDDPPDGSTYGTTITVATGVSNFEMVAISSTSFLAAYHVTDDEVVKAVKLTASGMSLSAGTAATVLSSAAGQYSMGLCVFSGSQALLATFANDTTTMKMVPINISSTPSPGTAVSLSDQGGALYYPLTLNMIPGTSYALLSYSNDDDSTQYARRVNASGTLDGANTMFANSDGVAMPLSSSHGVILGRPSNRPTLRRFTIAGSTFTPGEDVEVDSSSYGNLWIDPPIANNVVICSANRNSDSRLVMFAARVMP